MQCGRVKSFQPLIADSTAPTRAVPGVLIHSTRRPSSANLNTIPALVAMLLAAVASPSAARANTAKTGHALDSIIETEHAFAQESVQQGTKRSFLNYVAPDGVIFRPKPVAAPQTLAKDPEDNPKEGFLDWWPVLAGVSRSGDLGFSVGPWHQHLSIPVKGYPDDTYGYYCTVWRKQPDGKWKFVIDGAGAFLRTTPPTRARGSKVERLIPNGAPRSSGGGSALNEVRRLEAALAKGARSDAATALESDYSPRAWVMGSHIEVTPGPAGWRSELKRRPTRMDLQYVGGGGAAAGDLVYTYGLVGSLDPKTPFTDATYLHIWMRNGARWQIVFDGIKQRRSFD